MLRRFASFILLVSLPAGATIDRELLERSRCNLALKTLPANDNGASLLRFPPRSPRLRLEPKLTSEVMVIQGANETLSVDLAEPKTLSLNEWSRAVEMASALPAYSERLKLYRAAVWRVIETSEELTARSHLLFVVVQGTSQLYPFEPQGSRALLDLITKFVIMDKVNPDLERRMNPLTRLSLLSSIVAGLKGDGLQVLGAPYRLLIQEWSQAQRSLPAEARG